MTAGVSLLRKKAHENLLLKKCHPKNQQLSTYTETAKLLSFRKQPVLFNENYKKIQQKIEDMKDMRKHLHMEIHIADKIINDFPFIKEIVQDKKKKLQFELDELTAYVNFLIKL